MRKAILDFPKQFRRGIKAAQGVNLKPEKSIGWPENIIVCGMGGSGLAGEILVNWGHLNLFCHKSYGLPPQAGNESLVICISYSGNTEETLSAFKEAYFQKLPLISITSGGELGRLSKKYGLPCAFLPPPLLPPRLALGEMTSALFQILINQNILSPEISDQLLELEKKLKPENLEEQGKRLAENIFQKIPIIYSSWSFRELALIWKDNLNETAKTFAICNFFPELNHNEIVGFENLREKFYLLILRDKKDHPKILKRMRITKDLLNKKGIEGEFIEMEGKNKLEKIFSTILLGFWTAYWLARKKKVDPTSVKIIEEIKSKMKK